MTVDGYLVIEDPCELDDWVIVGVAPYKANAIKILMTRRTFLSYLSAEEVVAVAVASLDLFEDTFLEELADALAIIE